MDVGLSLVALGLFAPVQLVARLGVALEDQGPLYFSQERVGKQGRPFRIYKLRTMRDGRVTRLGRWLRATGLDETPQFFNVLRGEMSIVGPRPLTASDLERLGWQALQQRHPRFAVAPGITGLAQVFGGGNPRRVLALDALYARHASALLDVQLIGVSFAMNLLGKATVQGWLRHSRASRRAGQKTRPPFGG